MTRQRSFKRLVRARMAKTGESYAAARSTLLGAQVTRAAEQPVLITSDDAIRERTGRGWEEWFDALDEWGAAERPHREIARWVAEQLGIVPLGWAAQAVTKSYERARLGQAVGEHPDGFTVTASRTVDVHVERLYDAFVDESIRAQWLPDGQLRERTATRPASARYDWDGGETRVAVTFAAKDEAKSLVAVSHSRIVDAASAAETKAWWRSRLTTLKSWLEEGGADA